MILQKIKLKNFRQFKGEQEIVFSETIPSITIVYGANGRGKTGLFRALMFGLFDDRRLPQDDNINAKDINLVNKQALEENEGHPVMAEVTVVLLADGVKYTIKRCIQGIKRGDQTAEQPFGVTLSITDEKGNTKPSISDPVDIGEIIGKIFDPKIKEYFLFDGEKIERLTRADSAQKRTVAQGIKNLLSINDLETARRSLEILRANLNSQINSRSQGQLPKILRAIEDNANAIKQNNEASEVAKDNLDNAQKQKDRLDAELDKISEIKGLLIKRREYIKMEDELKDSQKNRISFLSGKISAVANALLKDCFNHVYSVLDEKKDAGEIPVADKLELIKKILSENRCICGNCVKKGTSEYDEIIKWRKRINDSGLSDEALNIWKDLSAINQMIPSTIEDVQRTLTEYENSQRRILSIQEDLKSLSENINDGAEESARRFNVQREECLKSIGELEKQIKEHERIASQLYSEKEDLAKKKEKVIQEEGVKSELSAAANLAADTYNALDEIYNSFTEDMKKQISKQASRIMSHLLDKEGRYSLKSIVVKDDYSLQVNDHRNEPFLANISAGQRQIISLCFITALAQVANGTDRFEIPLFMDTPFGRLSFEHRNNLIRFIPQICQQWVTMMTDTELTDREWAVYTNSEFPCAFYKLRSQEDGTTQIVSIPIDEVKQALV